jgi:hypothetical protein
MSTVLDATQALGLTGLLYSATVAVTALSSVFARRPARREAARETLKVLLVRRRNDA